MEAPWRQEVTQDVRKQMIMEMYHEVLRISGEKDKQKVWASVAKFELMLWSSCDDRDTYMTKIQRKIDGLRHKPLLGPTNAVAQQTQAGIVAPPVPQPPAAQVPPAPTATTPGATAALTLQQQAQQWLQRLQGQFQVQQQQLLRMQQQEAAQLRTQQLQQQQQLAQQHQQQAVSSEQRHQQLQQLQQQHEIARARLLQMQKAKQQQLQQKQQQYLLQKKQQLQARPPQQPQTTQPAQQPQQLASQEAQQGAQDQQDFHQQTIRENQQQKNRASAHGQLIGHVMELCYCPISLEIMTDPVITPSGISYERAMIEQHLEVNGPFDPSTNETLTKDDLRPNRALRQLVEMMKPTIEAAEQDEQRVGR